ncbi:MAG: transposase [Nitrososphaerota archaeon]|nr:transposase [Nitrososphaerota archaeon]
MITRACTILGSRRKSERRGFETRHGKPLRPVVCIILGFFVTAKGRLFVPLWKRGEYADVVLNRHAQQRLTGKELRSLTITPGSLSLCYSQEVEEAPVRTVYGVDRNEKNMTFGDAEGVVQIDMADTVKIRQTTRRIVGSFKRDGARVRRKLASKYWKRCRDRTSQILHAATNFAVDVASRNGAALALEDLIDIRSMYRKGNGQGPDYRFRLNSWPFWKACRMLEYKSAWKGVTMIRLTRSETYGPSSECGERLYELEREDAGRMLWCRACKMWTDMDVNAALNLSRRGLARFASSLPPRPASQQVYLLATGDKGGAVEAVKGNTTKTAILRVDASKSSLRPDED